ncbi:phage tail tip lysozyme [Nocardia brasiliensis]
MSPAGTKTMGDLHELPDCAPAGLEALRVAAEGIIQRQIRLLGSGTPSQAPDLSELLRDQGIAKPEDQSVMIDQYNDNKAAADKATAGIERTDNGIVVETDGIGGVVTDAYAAIDAAVGRLNGDIDASHNSVLTVRDDDGNVTKELPREVVSGLFGSIWNTVDTTYEKVNGVSDQAAAAALKIGGGNPNYPPMNIGAGGSQPVSYAPAGYSGRSPGGSSGTPRSHRARSTGPVAIPPEDRPTALEMMKYLTEKYGLTPAQAAGIVANAKYESNFSVNAKGDGGTAEGLFQWRFNRLDGLDAFAQQPGENRDDWRTHVDYMMYELRTVSDYQAAENSLDSNKNNAGQVAADFDAYYEKSSGDTMGARIGYAEALVLEWNQANSGAASTSAPSVVV